jgi:hypothetical protein
LRIKPYVAAVFQYINSVSLDNLPQPAGREVKALGDFFQGKNIVRHA